MASDESTIKKEDTSADVTIDVRGVSKGFVQFTAVQKLSLLVYNVQGVGFLGPYGS